MKLFRLNLKMLVLGCLLVSSTVLSGQRQVSGVVTDQSTGETLIGVNILVKGSSTGTITDFDGAYSLSVPEGATELEFSYTGYTAQTVALGAATVIDVQLVPGTQLEEVIVIGYGTVKREDATGAIQSVSAEDFNKGAITSAQDLISGKVAGVQITTSGGPGASSQIRIRGGSSLSASNDPLIVIDGVPIENDNVSGNRNILSLVNPNDIATFTVLKDASATAIYGSRASNGVIIITTKTGKAGQKLRISYNGNLSLNNPIGRLEVFTGDEYRNLITETFDENHPSRDLLGMENTDWQDVIYQQSIGTDHNLSFSGALASIPYRVSVGYTDMKGVVMTERFQRTTASLNLNPKFIDNRLQINFGVKTMFNTNQYANGGAIGAAIVFDPTQPVYDEDSPFGGYFTWVNNAGSPNTLAPANPLAQLELRDEFVDIQRYLINGSADYRFGFLPQLRANLNLAYDFSQGMGTIDAPANASFAYDQANGGGTMNDYSGERENQLLEFYLNYVEEFGPTELDVMAGYSWQRFYYLSKFNNSNLNGTEVQAGEDSGELYLLGMFGRINYTILEDYLFTFTLRRDGTSRFSPDSRWGWFPAGAFAWKIIEEDDATVSKVKLRLGYGITGQQAVGGFYGYLPRYQFGFDNAQYQFGDEFITTVRPNGYNSSLKWEETTTYNAGIDFGFMGNRIAGSIDYYRRNTSDLLNYIRIPAGTNLTNFIDSNVGELKNTGVEVILDLVPVENEEVVWDLSFNAAYNVNEITKLTATDDPDYIGIQVGGITGGVGNTIQVHSVGHPASSFLVYEQVYDESGNPLEGEYVDQNGDGIINNEDLYRYEKPAPDWLFGVYSSVDYKNFTLSFAGRSNIGNYIYNNIQSESYLNRLYASTKYLSNIPAVGEEIGFQAPQYFSDYFIQDGSFFRIDHITLSYFWEEVFAKSNLTMSVVVQNPILVTNYTGIDPELNNGIDGNIFPRSRTILFGVNLTL